jgi:hypothetical protein
MTFVAANVERELRTKHAEASTARTVDRENEFVSILGFIETSSQRQGSRCYQNVKWAGTEKFYSADELKTI